MSTDNPLFVLAVLVVFELVGGSSIGSALRQIVRQGPSVTGCFALIWGAGFEIIPLLLGAILFLGGGMPILFAIQLAVLFGTVGVVILAPEELWTLLHTEALKEIFLGAVVLLVVVGLLVLNRETLFNGEGVLAAFLFAALGVWLLASGLVKAVKEERQDEGI